MATSKLFAVYNKTAGRRNEYYGIQSAPCADDARAITFGNLKRGKALSPVSSVAELEAIPVGYDEAGKIYIAQISTRDGVQIVSRQSADEVGREIKCLRAVNDPVYLDRIQKEDKAYSNRRGFGE